MPLQLIEPGKRKGNRFYLIRGMVNGREREVSTKTTDRRVAEELLVKFHAALLESDITGGREEKTFSGAARIYVNARNPSHEDLRLIEKLETVLGQKKLTDIRQMHLDEAANVLCRGLTNETKNRKVSVRQRPFFTTRPRTSMTARISSSRSCPRRNPSLEGCRSTTCSP